VEVVSYRLHALWKGRSTTQELDILNTYGWEIRSWFSHLSVSLFFSNGTLRQFNNTLSRVKSGSKKITHYVGENKTWGTSKFVTASLITHYQG